jgi:hypothetical protein
MTKKEMLARKIPSPNMADAVMMLIFSPVVEQEFKEIVFEGWQ